MDVEPELKLQDLFVHTIAETNLEIWQLQDTVVKALDKLMKRLVLAMGQVCSPDIEWKSRLKSDR